MRFLLSFTIVFISLQAFGQPKKEYYDANQSQLKSETEYYKGMPHGPFTEFYQSGKVSRRGFYKFGKEDSVWTYLYPNGKKKAIENFVSGKKWGTNHYFFK